MAIHYLCLILEGMITILLASSVFSFPPSEYAQSLQSWSGPVNLSTSGLSVDPALVVDSEREILSSWTQTLLPIYTARVGK